MKVHLEHTTIFPGYMYIKFTKQSGGQSDIVHNALNRIDRVGSLFFCDKVLSLLFCFLLLVFSEKMLFKESGQKLLY